MIHHGEATSSPYYRHARDVRSPSWPGPGDSDRGESWVPTLPRVQALPPFENEASLVAEFVRLLESGSSPFGHVRILLEFEYIRGRTDVVAIDYSGRVIAFEMKLRRWSDALHQGYRNKCFAHTSYVVMPATFAQLALRQQRQFERRGVGLCAARPGALELTITATSSRPLQPALTARAVALSQE